MEKKISAITVSDNLLFCGYEDGLVLVWRQERRDVIDKNILKSWKRSRSIVKKEENEKKSSLIINSEENVKNKNIDLNENQNEENEEEEKENENEYEYENENNLNLNMYSHNNSNLHSEESKKNINTESKKNVNDNLNESNSSTKKKGKLYDGPTMSKKYLNYVDKENTMKAYDENFVREGKFRIDDIILFSLKDDITFYKSTMVEEFEKLKDEKGFT